jgi:hypothetical protein
MEVGIRQSDEERLLVLKITFTKTTNCTQIDHKQKNIFQNNKNLTNQQIYAKLKKVTGKNMKEE